MKGETAKEWWNKINIESDVYYYDDDKIISDDVLYMNTMLHCTV